MRSNTRNDLFGHKNKALALAGAGALGFALVGVTPAEAVPSFARQTGQPCAACHTAFPELTPFGRRFKLTGYTVEGGDWKLPPLAAMIMPGFTHTAAAQDGPPGPGLRNNDNFAVQQITGLYAGKIYGDLGAFIQVSADPVNKVLWFDGSDIRYVKNFKLFGKDTYVGIDVNNTPTVQDVWNTVDSWAFPELSSGFAAFGPPGVQIDSLAQTVAGAGAYLWWNDMLYIEENNYFGYSRGTLEAFGMQPGSSPNLPQGVNPYWRIALEPHWGNHYLEVGTYGMYSQQVPASMFGSGTDKYLDTAVDMQYQYDGDKYSVTVKAADIYESQRLDASAVLSGTNRTDWLNSFKVNASYVWDHTYSLTAGYFNVTGSADAILYGDAGCPGCGFSLKNLPNTDGLIFDAAYLPFSHGAPGPDKQFNVRLGVQYIKYLQIGGGTNNFTDAAVGGTRNASGNDTLFLYAWAAF